MKEPNNQTTKQPNNQTTKQPINVSSYIGLNHTKSSPTRPAAGLLPAWSPKPMTNVALKRRIFMG